MHRCTWVPENNLSYQKYHDEEWGVPVFDDRTHFEFLILEAAQAGLSWETVLKRREGYRRLFADFDVQKVARFSEDDFERILNDSSVIRNKLKIRAAITNARHFIEIQREFGSFSKYIWQFVQNKPIVSRWKSIKEIPAQSAESVALSKDLKKRGFTFVGPTIMYAHMQATGLVNDHTIDCFRKKACIIELSGK